MRLLALYNCASQPFYSILKVADGGHEHCDRPPVYCPELGLSIEKLKEGYTLDSLWQILPPEPSKKNLD